MGFLASIGKITMKREGQYYLLIGLLVCALAFLQFNPFKKERLAVVSDVKKITEIDQLIIKMKCNVFFIEGDEQSIVYEAPARLIEKIRIDNNKGFVTIGMEKKGIVARLWEYFHPVSDNRINIYVIVRNIKAIQVGDLLKKASSCNTGQDFKNMLFNNPEDGVLIGIMS